MRNLARAFAARVYDNYRNIMNWYDLRCYQLFFVDFNKVLRKTLIYLCIQTRFVSFKQTTDLKTHFISNTDL